MWINIFLGLLLGSALILAILAGVAVWYFSHEPEPPRKIESFADAPACWMAGEDIGSDCDGGDG